MAFADSNQSVPIAIIGVGCLMPKADGVDAFWSNIQDGVDAIGEVPPSHWRPEDYFDKDPKRPDHTYAARGGFLSPVEFPALELGISPNTLEAIDTTQLLGLLVAKRTLESAGYGADRDFDRNRVSVILGVTGTLELVVPLGARLGHPRWKKALKDAGVDDAVAEEVVQKIADSYVGWQEDSFPGLLGNVVAGRIANRLDLGGTNCVVDAACASSLSALHLAMLELASGRSDMALTGGMDTFNDIFMYMCFSKTPALSPTGQARPFDAQADGTILGEGLGCVLLKRLADAERDGDTILAVIRSLGASSDGKGQAIYAPSPAGQAKALRQAYQLADVTPETIELVEAHGTGTRAGDAAEVAALCDVYQTNNGRGAPWCALGSVKSQIGHTKAAAGAAGLIKAALALHHKVLPPTLHVNRPIDRIVDGQGPFYVNTEKRPWMPSADHPRRAAVSAFGFGGSNFHCVLEEYGSSKPQAARDGLVQIVALSATSAGELRSRLDAFPAAAAWGDFRIHAARSRASFDAKHDFRLTFVVQRDKTPPAEAIAAARAALAAGAERKTLPSADGVFVSLRSAAGKCALIFPGQGSQSTGMMRDLTCRFPEMHETLADADAVFAAHRPADDLRRLSDLIYPMPAFDAPSRTKHDADLRATDVAQPALGALGLGAARLLASFGVRPDAVAGHSFGELTGLCAAGWIDATDFHSLAHLRGRLMAEGAGDRGGMLAVRAPLAAVETVLRDDGLDLTVANRNAPNQAVLSGASAAIAKARESFARRRIDCAPLPVAAAFHSPFVADASRPFLAALDAIGIEPTAIPVFCNSTAKEYPRDPQQVRQILAQQLAQPVEFVAEIENLYAAGVRTFLEVGPGSKLSPLIASILADRPHTVLTLDAAAGKRSGIVDFARVLAHAAALGHSVDLTQWDDGQAENLTSAETKPTLTVPLCGANYVKSKSPPAPVVVSAVKPSKNGDAAHGPRATPVRSVEFQPAVAHIEATIPSAPSARPAIDMNNDSSATHEGLLALQKLGEQTAQLHRQFLEGQERALSVLQTLIDRGHCPAPATSTALATESHAVARSVKPPIGAPVAVTSRSIGPTAAPTVAATASRNGNHQEVPAPTTNHRVESSLLEVVATVTGYPAEMLQLDMELDTDLGIDSIKRVEIFALLQERFPHAPPVKSEQMGAIRTLRQVAGLLDVAPSNGHVPQAETAAIPPEPSNGRHRENHRPSSKGTTAKTLLEVVATVTGYPAEMLQLDMELDTDLGIDSIKRVEIFALLQEKLPHAPAVKSDQMGAIRTLRQVAELLDDTDDNHARDAHVPLPPDKDEHPQTNRRPGTSKTHVANGQLEKTLLDVVAGVTGYPAEMLQLDMELDTDLGIDSIKRVEIFAVLQEKLPGAPAVKSEQMGNLRTLRHVAAFLGDTNGHIEPPCTPAPTTIAANGHANGKSRIAKERRPAVSAGNTLQRLVLTAANVIESTARNSLALVRDGEVWISADDAALAPFIARRLNSLGIKTRVIPADDVRALAAPSRLAGLIILVSLSTFGDPGVLEAFQLLQTASGGLRGGGQGGDSAFMTVTRIDGQFGLSGASPVINPIAGGLAGLAKTARLEWPNVHCKALDLAPTMTNHDEAAACIVDEFLTAGPAEVGISPEHGRQTLSLVSTPHAPSARSGILRKGDVVIVTGGARGVTAEAAVALAEAYAPALVLLGRSAQPTPEPNWLAALTAEADIKRALHSQMNGQATPKDIGDRCRAILANREILDALHRIEAAGATAIYRQIDVRDEMAVRALVSEIRRDIGPIKGLLHGAGVLADRRIEEKTPEQFQTVFATKAASARTLLEALEPDDLRVVAFFSSSTGRFGRVGQIDYAAANEVLNKLAQREAARRPTCRVVALNWGPWDGGMVTPSLKKIFAGEGVGLIPLRQGAEFLVAELEQPVGGPVEVVVLGPAPADAPAQPFDPAPTDLVVAFEQEVSVASLPVLKSHVLKGRAVVPVALMVEWFAHAALHGNPGLAFVGLDNLRVFKGIVLAEGESLRVRVLASKAAKENGEYRVAVEIHGISSSSGRDVLHARAGVLLAARLGQSPISSPPMFEAPYTRTAAEIYGEILFHGPDLQGILRVESCAEAGIAAVVATAPAPADWIENPVRSSWIANPLALDCAFQLMIVWSHEHCGAGSLPSAVGRYRQFRRSFPREGVTVVARVTQRAAQRARADIDFLDHDGAVVARIVDYDCVIDDSLHAAFRANRLAVPSAPTS